jgi:ligand-binding sensor domain-containing protein
MNRAINNNKNSLQKDNFSHFLIYTFSLFVCLIINDSLLAQNQFNHLSQAEGLSNKNVNCIIQDHNGFMWFGTNDGLNRYDGYSFTIFRTSPNDSCSIGSNFITCLYEDNTGLLWIGTRGGGLNIYDPRTEKFSRFIHDPGNQSSISSNDVLSIHFESRNKIWIGTDGGGLNIFDYNSKSFSHFYAGLDSGNISSNEIIAINASNSGDLWIGTWNGGLNYAKSNESVFSMITDSNGRQIKHIWSLTNESNEKLWIGTFGYGLFCLDMKSKIVESIKLNKNNTMEDDKVVWTVYQDDFQDKWIGTNNGLYKLDKKGALLQHFQHFEDDETSLSSNKVISIYQSITGIIWVGTDNGVNYLNPNTKKFHKNMKINTLKNNSIYALSRSAENGIWIASEKSGICKIQTKKTDSKIVATLQKFENIKLEGKINTILEDSKNILWIGTRYGLVQYNLENGQQKKYIFDINDIQNSSNDVLAICESEIQDEFWIGTDNGLYLYNFETGQFKKYVSETGVSTSINSNHILTIYKDKRKNIWVSTWKGLNRYNPKTDNFISVEQADVNNMYINSLHDDSRGNLWLGTRFGLYKYNLNSGTTTSYTEEDGLSNNNICSIIDDLRGSLWLSTSKGLSKFNLSDNNFKNFDSQDGLLNTTFNTNSGFLSNDGTIFLGGTNGLDAFIPDEIKTDTNEVTLVFDDFRVSNKRLPIGQPGSPLKQSITETKDIILTHREDIFSIGFVALNFINSNKCKYEYKLEGLQKDWIKTETERRATFTNLNAGEYVFKVRASNEDGIWSDNVISLNITVLPPWWKSRWFKATLAASVLLIFFIYNRYRIYQYHKRNKKLEKIIEARVKEINRQKEILAHQTHELSKSNKLLNEQNNEIERQATEINRMNELLLIRNENLEENVEELSRARAMNTCMTFEEFKQIYPNDESCRKFIYELKLKSGFYCHSCQNTKSKNSVKNYSRRCTQCGYVESVTVGTPSGIYDQTKNRSRQRSQSRI